MTMRGRARRQRGMTLIEIMVVLALMAIMMAVAIPSLSSVLGMNQSKASRHIAGLMRYVYEEAQVRNVPMRIVFDLDHRQYWVEESAGPARIFRDRDQKEAFDEFMADKAVADAQLRKRAASQPAGIDINTIMSNMVSSGGEDGEGLDGGPGGGGGLLGTLLGGALGGGIQAGSEGAYKPNQFTPVTDEYGFGDKKELPDGVKFWGVFTPQYDEILKPLDEYELEANLNLPPEEQQWRVAYTHVFPGGYMEDAVVYISDESGQDITSLLVEPLMGRVKVIEGEVDPPDTRDREHD